MAKNIIKIDESANNIRVLAIHNKIKPTSQNLVDLSFRIVNDVYNHLDSKEFTEITGLVKK